ncbi:MAG TPA: succinylglutamate desuccinylase/aspartoacylase family protein [Methylibium sp.]|uniref:succinylglutamate desuccinylase/aspartoacylase family protein n=1 Tax=Methylibium sp. TaxID=2067992 RepID=UPI002DB97458|nr:succinylglutamate desuccinylase/aspartoacylase family protein [Methylibium sp.]HEU4457610.1 succinylglutamate desuccinylase/aspartoacylase family protein [Methylibium sp.]
MERRDHPLPPASLGTQRTLTSFHYGRAGSGEKIYVQASLHADELPGMLVAHHLRRRLGAIEAQGALRGEVVVVPLANPIGVAQRLLHSVQGRFDLGTGENFNRHYPALRDAVWARIEPQLGADAQANLQLARAALRDALAALPADTELAAWRRQLLGLACDADVVLDLHCDTDAVLHLYTLTPLWPACEPLARILGAHATLLATESGDHPFDEACSQIWWQLAGQAGAARPIPLGCFSVTVELRGSADVSHALAEADADALIEYLRHRGVVTDRASAPLPPLIAEATPLAGSLEVRTPTSGVVAWHRKPGERVERGDLLGEVIDPIEGTTSELRSETDGVLYALDTIRFATAGARLAKVAGRDATRTGKLLGD